MWIWLLVVVCSIPMAAVAVVVSAALLRAAYRALTSKPRSVRALVPMGRALAGLVCYALCGALVLFVILVGWPLVLELVGPWPWSTTWLGAVDPLTYFIAPWYAALEMGQWLPLLICHGPILAIAVLSGLAQWLLSD